MEKRSHSQNRYRLWLYYIGRAIDNFHEHQDEPELWGTIQQDLGQIYAIGQELLSELTKTRDPIAQDTVLAEIQTQKDKTKKHDESFLRMCSRYTESIVWHIFRQHLGEDGKRWLQMGLVAAQSLQQTYQEGLFLNQLGIWYDLRGDKQLALDYFNQSLPLTEQANDTLNVARTLLNIGSIYLGLEQPEQSLVYFQDALQIFHSIEHLSGEAIAVNNIGTVYEELDDAPKALGYFKQALDIYHQLGQQAGESTTLNNMGLVYYKLGELDKAFRYYEKALTLKRLIMDEVGEGAVLNNMGLVVDAQGDKSQALSYYQGSLQLRKETGDLSGQIITLRNIGSLLWSLGQHQEALAYLNASRDFRAYLGLNTEIEDQTLRIRELMIETGIYDLEKLTALVEHLMKDDL